ncbi:MAG TPA: threonine synthase [Vicinamibacteria bacterium]|nr:threonine synthase [Vicinamibacteria bacterium]
MSFLLRCATCGTHVPVRSSRVQCVCGGLLDVLHCPGLSGRQLRARFDRRLVADRAGPGSGVWRFRELVLPGVVSPVSHPEGNTGLYRRPRVSRYVGLTDFAFKHEGENPTGSFKDRGMTVAVTQALRAGARAVACASTGNTSASMAAYAAQAGLPALVFVPAGKVPAGKLAQALAYGARTLLVRGDFDACLRLAREASEALGLMLLNSINPWRIEGQKTIVLEMLQQRGWEAPDWIVVPAGNLGNTAAFGKALLEAQELGLIKRLPRIAAIQAAGANPFYRSFRTGFRERFRVKAETVATAIRIGDPASFERAVRAVRATKGVVAAVQDREILEAKAVVDAAGIGCEPASAAAVAGARQLKRRGLMRAGESVVAVLTGHLLKDPQSVIDFHRGRTRGANPPLAIDATVSAVERVLERSRFGKGRA